MPLIMASSKYGEGHKDKYLDTSTKILSQEILNCNMKALIFIILLWIISFFNIKFKVKRFYTKNRNIHVKYENAGNHCWNVISKVKVFKKWDKLQGHRSINFDTLGRVLSQGLLMRNIKDHSQRLKFSKNRSNSKVKAKEVKKVGTHRRVLSREIFVWNIKVIALTV